MRSFLPPSLTLALVLGSAAARAQGTDPAAAQAMFDDAKRLVEQGKLGEACPKFLTSFKLDPKPGALMNLADCYEKNGQNASAWARYLEAASLAQHAGQAEREQYARQHAASLEPRLSRLSIKAPTAPPGLEVKRDGAVIDMTMLGVAVPVDPGKHQIEARAPGKKPWTTTVEVPPGGGQIKVDVPALEDGGGAPVAPPVGPVAPGGTPPPPAPEGPVPFWGAQRIAGTVVGVVGLGLVAAGSAFGAKAASKWSSAKNDHCGGTTVCDATGVSLAADARSAATLSSATFIPGAAALVAGIVVFATAPKARSAPQTGFVLAPAPLRGGAALALTGAL